MENMANTHEKRFGKIENRLTKMEDKFDELLQITRTLVKKKVEDEQRTNPIKQEKKERSWSPPMAPRGRGSKA